MDSCLSYSRFLRPLLFRLDPEKAHNLLVRFSPFFASLPYFLAYFAKKYAFLDSRLAIKALGLSFDSPIGLAAGFDKNAEMVRVLATLGFSHLELGTITPRPQEGNPKPRLFRLLDEESIQNAMGFNNHGQEQVAQNLQNTTPFVIPLGINLGKNKDTPNEDSLKDYQCLLEALSPYASYITINLSSPNTPNLRDLQNESFIKDLFQMAQQITDKPILLKIAPDMEIENALSLGACALEHGASGIIATNTTIDYRLSAHAKEVGGISGKLLKEKSFVLFQALGREFFAKTTLVSVGGVDDAKEVYRRIRAGATLVQIYTALIYQGPSLIYHLKKGLIELLEQDGFSHVSEAVGVDIS